MVSRKNKKQRRPRRTFTDEFRADVVRPCQAGGDPTHRSSAGLVVTKLRRWSYDPRTRWP